MLDKNPKRRPTVKEVLKHSLLEKYLGACVQGGLDVNEQINRTRPPEFIKFTTILSQPLGDVSAFLNYISEKVGHRMITSNINEIYFEQLQNAKEFLKINCPERDQLFI